ncbi:hypothetical protein [Flexivirga oryzae]|uniref:Uncharacterized protein n=1 Tax=Flexivirga oryzae TaxID=1794944 RepID=A0A839NFU1_9MICO|nr:hypothetical protein [Flexivirga oryzae]MBB2893352.1 hypothetical protein [Flexivirga oryzae]
MMRRSVDDAQQRLLLEDERFLARSQKLRYHEIAESGDDGTLRAAVPVYDAEVSELPILLRRYMGIDDVTGLIRCVGGGLAIRRSVFYENISSDENGNSLASLLEKNGEWIMDFPGTIYALYATSCEAGLLQGIAPDATATDHGTTHYSLQLPGGDAIFDDFVATLTAPPRRTWKVDISAASNLELTYSAAPLSPQQIPELAPLISDVAARNGIRQPLFVQRQILRNLLTQAGEPVVVRSSIDGRPAGACVCRRYDTFLDAFQVGIIEHENRREIYHFTAFVAPLLYALSRLIPIGGVGVGV